MRKIGMMLAWLVCTGMAQAGEYAYLVFVNQNNDTTALSVTDMTLKVNDNSLTVTNAEGTVNFTLTDLQFMQFMTGEFAETEMAKCGQIPVNKAALESETVKAADYAPFIEAIQTAKARPTVAAWSEMDNDLTVAMTAVVSGEKTAQEAMDELAAKWDELLK